MSVELTGRYVKKELGEHGINQSIYNISIPLEYLFYAFVFRIHYENKVYKQASAIFITIFPVFVLVNILFIQGFGGYNSNIVKIGTLSMVLLACFYFLDLLRMEGDVKLLQIPMFWIATGVLLFNAGEFLFSIALDYLFDKFPKETFKVFGSIIFKLICVLYTCISISVLCSGKKLQKA
ncbi:MAG TPA: hypothetical protein VGO58_03105 [Chitinophagaceae bacterium]|nr:hypothetical protein [Chitinophagaceae bacterium]